MKKTLALTLSLIICALSLVSCSEWYVKVDGEKFTESEYNYFYNNHCDDLRYSYPDMEDSEVEEKAKEMTLDSLRRIRAIDNLADEYKVSLTDEEKKSAEEKLDSYKSQYENDEAFIKDLESTYLSEELCLKLFKREALETKLREYLSNEYNGVIDSDDETVEKDIRENFFRATQILIQNDEGDDAEANRATAQLVRDLLDNGEDFYALAEQYSEDSIDIKNGYYFTAGEMLEEFEEAVKSLSENQTSGVVKSRYGYHIILRLSLDDEYIDENFESLRNKYKSRCINEMIEERADEMTVKFSH